LQITRLGMDGSSPSLVRDESGTGGHFRLQNLPAGRFKVMARAAGTWRSGTSYWYHEPVEVELVPGSVEHRLIEVRMGGRLQVLCTNRSGVALGARCQVFDDLGSEIPVTFFAEANGSIWIGASSLNPSAPGGVNQVDRNLPAGRYEVRFTMNGYRDAVRTLVVEAGKTAEVTVVMEES
jgi:hypothetical protein